MLQMPVWKGKKNPNKLIKGIHLKIQISLKPHLFHVKFESHTVLAWKLKASELHDSGKPFFFFCLLMVA